MERTPIRRIIGKNIRHQRRLAGLTQQALGARLGISGRQIQKYESGMNGMSCDRLVQVAETLRCSVNELCDTILRPS